MTCSAVVHVRQRKSPGSQVRWWQGRQGGRGRGFRRTSAGRATASSARGAWVRAGPRPARSSWRPRAAGHCRRPHRRRRDDRSQLVQIEISQVGHRRGECAQRPPCGVGNLPGGGCVGRSRRQEDTSSRVAPHERFGQRLERGWRPAAERVAGAHVDHHERRLGGDAGRPQARVGAARGRRVVAHFHRVHGGVGFRNAEEGRQQIPMVWYRVARAQIRRPGHPAGVHPAAALDFVADAPAGPAGPGEPAAARPAVQVDPMS